MTSFKILLSRHFRITPKILGFLIVTCYALAGCSDGSDAPGVNTRLKVMSYNLRYADTGLLVEENTRKDPLVASINQHKPDFLGVQEANEPWMDVLPEMLPEYSFVGVGRDDGLTSGEFAAIFLPQAEMERTRQRYFLVV